MHTKKNNFRNYVKKSAQISKHTKKNSEITKKIIFHLKALTTYKIGNFRFSSPLWTDN